MEPSQVFEELAASTDDVCTPFSRPAEVHYHFIKFAHQIWTGFKRLHISHHVVRCGLFKIM